jgi:hypothetical protein
VTSQYGLPGMSTRVRGQRVASLQKRDTDSASVQSNVTFKIEDRLTREASQGHPRLASRFGRHHRR